MAHASSLVELESLDEILLDPRAEFNSRKERYNLT